jgi:hypothetical protein
MAAGSLRCAQGCGRDPPVAAASAGGKSFHHPANLRWHPSKAAAMALAAVAAGVDRGGRWPRVAGAPQSWWRQRVAGAVPAMARASRPRPRGSSRACLQPSGPDHPVAGGQRRDWKSGIPAWRRRPHRPTGDRLSPGDRSPAQANQTRAGDGLPAGGRDQTSVHPSHKTTDADRPASAPVPNPPGRWPHRCTPGSKERRTHMSGRQPDLKALRPRPQTAAGNWRASGHHGDGCSRLGRPGPSPGGGKGP